MDKDNVVSFISEDNEEIEFTILEQTKLNGQTYILASSDYDEETAYILKDTSDAEEETSIYEFVEDEEEIKLVSRIFEEILEDVSFELE